MRSDDLAPLLAAAADNRETLGFRQGRVIAWDDATGSNVIEIAGQQFSDLPVISSGALMVGAGDLVAVTRYRSTYLITGVVTTAGTGALGMKADFVDINESTNSTTPVDLPTHGPEVTVYIGGSRRCLVFLTCGMFVPPSAVATGATAAYTFAVTGASNIPATDVWGQSAFVNNGDTGGQIGGSASATVLLTAADGLQRGMNTFTAKYWQQDGNSPIFTQRRISVMPF